MYYLYMILNYNISVYLFETINCLSLKGLCVHMKLSMNELFVCLQSCMTIRFFAE